MMIGELFFLIKFILIHWDINEADKRIFDIEKKYE